LLLLLLCILFREAADKIKAKLHHQITHLPPAIRNSTGRIYNITSQSVIKDPEAYEKFCAKEAHREAVFQEKFGRGENIRYEKVNFDELCVLNGVSCV
jgi:hypothetical protein